MSRRKTNNDSLIEYRTEKSMKKVKAKKFFMDFLKKMDDYYPYEYDLNLNRKKNKFCDVKPHFEFVCSKMQSNFLRDVKMKNVLFLIMSDKFYSEKGDNYNNMVTYISNLFNNGIKKSEKQRKIVDEIIESF